tara:strand:- start:4741 stop:6063 length:1323 start_codon:yes stop_codon:yes gene_type:complete
MANENISEKDKAAVKAMEKQSTATEMPEGTKIESEDQEVQTDELLTTADKKIDAPTKVKTPDAIVSTDQGKPKEFDAASYVSTKADDVGKAKAAKGQLSEGSIMTAAQGVVSKEALAEAATQELDPRATTRYQLAELFKGIEEGGPPPAWAAPAVRKVTAVMQSRGLGSSSMAAAATMQAMMESGIPIAAQDAQKYATIQLQNLNNEQQAALQNAAAVLQMDMANLNNRQQAAVNNAKAFLSMDMQNVTNEQQSNTLTYQAKLQTLLSDQAADNAAKQFNAKSENEINQFFAEMGASIEASNINRDIAVKQFNSNQKVAIAQFNAQMETAADQFNANMQLEIDQSNAVWRRTVNTRNTAAQNEANRQNALNLLGIQQNALNALWQRYRDKAAWTMKISENAKDRAHNAAMQAAAIAANEAAYDKKYDDFLKHEIIDKIWR